VTKKILVAEDEPELLKVTLFRLNGTGYEAFGAADGEEALDIARQRVPDLMLLDVFLPKMNSDEVARILKKDERLKHIPVILISAVERALKERARESGADGYLAKPFETAELLSMIEWYLASGAR
jgi:CheY-like chemotaxis protein